MNTVKKTKGITQNIIISISVQVISLLVSSLVSFLVPKFIDEYQYAYWQTYILYVGYVGVLHFGLLDGIVLRYSQYDFEQLDKARIRSQFKILLGTTSIIALVAAFVGSLITGGISRTTILFVAIGIVTKNLVTYNSYSFQITNRINKYAVLIITQRISYGLLAVLLLALHVNRFEYYCMAELSGDIICIILSRFFNKGMYFGKSLPPREAFREWRVNVSSGIILMFANWSAMLLGGFAKMIVQWHWDELTFGKISFSFSLSNLFLTFITAVSVVLFPQLKRTEQEKLPEIYKSIRNVLSPLLFVAMLAYYPGCLLIEKFLPKYSQSLIYLGLMLPIIIFTSKVSLLTNNYLKAFRKEKEMLRVNILSSLIAVAFFAVSAYIFDNLTALLICVVLSNLIKSVMSEQAVEKEIQMSFTKDYIIETAMTVMFIVYTNFLPRWTACAAYAMTLAVYLMYYRKAIFAVIQPVLHRIRSSK